MLDLKTFFERCYCINLARAPNRWEEFQKRIAACNWPLAEPVRFDAIDGKRVRPHPRWTEGGGAWGCLQSHLSIIQKCLHDGVKSVLILEDDAEPIADFSTKCQTFLENVPDNWGMIYLGGQHLHVDRVKPILLNDQVVIPGNLNRTHAYAISRRGMETIYHHLVKGDWWERKVHIDHWYGQLHARRTLPIYCPVEWLIWQAPGKSDVSGRDCPSRDWQISREKLIPPPGNPTKTEQPFYAIVGLHSSGSSAIAGVCYHLGMYLGDRLRGFYGNDPNVACGFEARGMAAICESLAPFPTIKLQQTPKAKGRFKGWLSYARNVANIRGTVAGVKYPHLCRLGAWLREFCGDSLRIIHCVRPLEDSIQSLASRGGKPSCSPDRADAVQRWLEDGKRELLTSIPQERVLDVPFYDLLKDTRPVVDRMAAFIGTHPSEENLARAVQSVYPDRKHIGDDAHHGH